MTKLKHEPIVWYVELKTFWDNKKECWKQTTVSKYAAKLKNFNSNSSYAEVLHGDFVIPYFDIDHLNPKYNIDKIIESLKKAFLSYFKCNTNTLIVTLTKNRSKESYHIFFKGTNIKYYVRKKDLKKFVKDFNSHFKIDNNKTTVADEYRGELLDTQVYGSTQIFRSVNQPKPNIHKKLAGPQTAHEVIKGKLEDTIIQNFNLYRDILVEPMINFE